MELKREMRSAVEGLVDYGRQGETPRLEKALDGIIGRRRPVKAPPPKKVPREWPTDSESEAESPAGDGEFFKRAAKRAFQAQYMHWGP